MHCIFGDSLNTFLSLTYRSYLDLVRPNTHSFEQINKAQLPEWILLSKRQVGAAAQGIPLKSEQR